MTNVRGRVQFRHVYRYMNCDCNCHSITSTCGHWLRDGLLPASVANVTWYIMYRAERDRRSHVASSLTASYQRRHYRALRSQICLKLQTSYDPTTMATPKSPRFPRGVGNHIRGLPLWPGTPATPTKAPTAATMSPATYRPGCPFDSARFEEDVMRTLQRATVCQQGTCDGPTYTAPQGKEQYCRGCFCRRVG